MGTSALKQKPIVLIVEDNREERKMVESYFLAEEFDVLTATTVDEARECLYSIRGDQFGIALVDINMWGDKERSFDLITYIHETASQRMRVYAYTGDDSDQTIDRAIGAGAHRVVIKVKDPLDRIRNYMESDSELLWGYGWDDITGLPNFRSFRMAVSTMMQTARDHPGTSYPSVFSLVFIDIDEFWVFNEYHGVRVGDEALRVVGQELREHKRFADNLCRKGGDEFIICLPGMPQGAAEAKMEDVKQAIDSLSISGKDGAPVSISVSYGIKELRVEDIGPDADGSLVTLIGAANEEESEEKKIRREARREKKRLKSV